MKEREEKKEKCEIMLEDYKRMFIEELIARRVFRLIFRPAGVKFEEGSAIVLMDVDTHNGFSIGDLCAPRLNRWHIYATGDEFISYSFSGRYRIAAFVSLTGRLKPIGVSSNITSRIKIKDMFCVLYEENTIKTVDKRPLSPILLFWLKGLERVKE